VLSPSTSPSLQRFEPFLMSLAIPDARPEAKLFGKSGSAL